MRFLFTLKSTNAKTGPIPVTTTTSDTCPDACPFREKVCYAKHGPLAIVWRRAERLGMDLKAFCEKVAALPKGQLWRHNQAGDLPGEGDSLDVGALRAIVEANEGRRGFTYTHKPLRTEAERAAVREANARGFAVNLSANDLAHADELADLNVGPVATVLPEKAEKGASTPAGRWVIVCPATRSDAIVCATCGLCAQAGRKAIVGFPVHGSGKNAYAS